jgi:predicted nucleotidyltransferase
MTLFQKLEQQAMSHGLRFLVIGGHAVIYHGFQRGTEDADILVNRDDRDAWLEIIKSFGYSLKMDGVTFLQFDAAAAEWDLDLMLVPPATFEGLFAAAPVGPLEGGRVRFASFEHLIALKAHALKHGQGLRVLKDLTDVGSLLQLKNVKRDAEWLRLLFAKHGTLEMYERVRHYLAE